MRRGGDDGRCFFSFILLQLQGKSLFPVENETNFLVTGRVTLMKSSLEEVLFLMRNMFTLMKSPLEKGMLTFSPLQIQLGQYQINYAGWEFT